MPVTVLESVSRIASPGPPAVTVPLPPPGPPRIMSGVSHGDGPVFKVIAGTRMIFFICGSHGDSQSQVTSPKFMSLARRGNLKLTVS